MNTNDIQDLLKITKKELLECDYLTYLHTMFKTISISKCYYGYDIIDNMGTNRDIYACTSLAEARSVLRQLKQKYYIK